MWKSDCFSECFSPAECHASQTREKDVGIMSIFMYDLINQQSVWCTGRSMENLPRLRAGARANQQNNGLLCVSLAAATTFPPFFCLSPYSFLFLPPHLPLSPSMPPFLIYVFPSLYTLRSFFLSFLFSLLLCFSLSLFLTVFLSTCLLIF